MYTSHNIGRRGIWKPWHCSLTWIKFCWNLVNTCWPKTYLNQNKRIWCFISSMCVFKGKWLVNKWSLLFQKSTQLDTFAFFSVFCDSRSQYRSYDHVLYIFSHLQNNAQLLLGADFLFNAYKIFLRPSKWPHETNFHTRDRIFYVRPCFILWNLTKITFSCRKIFFTCRMTL